MNKGVTLTGAQRSLVEAAEKVRENSYSPYSGLTVGAALLTVDGHVITGTNVENASFSLTICAERAAIVSAVSQGHKDFVSLALVAKGVNFQSNSLLTPCGACRQMLAEFAQLTGRDIEVVMASTDRSQLSITTSTALLPSAMSSEAVTGIL